jgi:hypothetical protein
MICHVQPIRAQWQASATLQQLVATPLGIKQVFYFLLFSAHPRCSFDRISNLHYTFITHFQKTALAAVAEKNL